MGIDLGGSGAVRLYEPISGALLIEWKHPKAVWVVRLSSDGALLAAAGYDCKLTLYSAVGDPPKASRAVSP